MTLKEITESELEAFISEDNKCSILLGNGLGLSHPDDSIKSFFMFNEVAIKKRVNDDIIQNFLFQGFSCPEEMMDYLRTELSLAILHNYLSDLKNLIKIPYQDKSHQYRSLHQYLNKFSNIYTLNYDPIIYKSLMGDRKSFIDGFNPNRNVLDNEDGIKLKFEDIEANLNGNNIKHKLFFLHGAFHLFCNYNDKSYYKLRRYRKNAESSFTSLNTNCEEIYEKILCTFRQTKSSEYSPLIVLAPRSTYKSAIIKEIKYLTLCSERLFEEDKVFVFGCSFKNDEHIMDTLLDGKKKNLVITYYTDQDKETITKLILEKKNIEHDIKFLKAKNSYFCKKIWGISLP